MAHHMFAEFPRMGFQHGKNNMAITYEKKQVE
jgi:hypothetical protein